MMKAPLRPGTRPVGAAQLAVKDTSTDGPGFAATPKGDGPRPQDWRGGVRVRGAPSTSAQLLTYGLNCLTHVLPRCLPTPTEEADGGGGTVDRAE